MAVAPQPVAEGPPSPVFSRLNEGATELGYQRKPSLGKKNDNMDIVSEIS